MNPTRGTAAYLQIDFLERKNAELEQQLAELREELEKTRNAIHQWMQTSDQRGSKDMLIANFVGMYTYKEISDE